MQIIGHRGARGLAPENTLESLNAALKHGVDMIEFDVRVTKDAIPVLHHNPAVVINGTSRTIADSTLAELHDLKPDVATLKEALTLARHVPLYIEVKSGVDTTPIIALLKNIQNIYLASKSQATLVALHEALPNVPTIVVESWSGVRAQARAEEVGSQIIAMNQRWLWWGFIRGFKHSKIKLYAYTLNNPRKARRWQRYGLSGVVTDYPDLFDK